MRLARLNVVALFAFVMCAALSACGGGGGGGGDATQTELVTVSGSIVDSNNDPVAGATVTVTSDPISTVTDAQGKFSVEVEPGAHTLTATKDGVTISERSLTASSGEPMDLQQVLPTRAYYPLGKTWFKDADGDGYSDGTNEDNVTQPTGYKLAVDLASASGDCDDSKATISPVTAEVCGNGIDDNCSGGDEACPESGPTWYRDQDSDGYSDGTTLTQVGQPLNYQLASALTATSGDCDDSDANVNPAATEVCGNGIDDDCSGGDENCPESASTWYRDQDSDGYSDGTTLTQVGQPLNYQLASALTATSGDCDDSDANVNPAATEICGNGKDDDCSGGDELCPVTWYKDADGDSYSDGTTLTQVQQPLGYARTTALSATSGDCNDAEANVNPGASEVCGNGVDDDCAGGDEACGGAASTWYKDADADGCSDGTTIAQVDRPTDYYLASELLTTTGDCNDSVSSIHPLALEVCGDGIDQDCDGSDLACIPVLVWSIFADDGTFLGFINDNPFDPDSVCNAFGTYGNKFSSLSIWNQFGQYGSNFSALSAFNDFAFSPPVIFENGVPIYFLTTNTIKSPRIDTNVLLGVLNANGCNVSR